VFNRVLGGQLTVLEAAGLLALSERQAQRILAAYREEGAAALAHGNRGRQPVNALSAELKAKVVELTRTRYAGCNYQFLSELLDEHDAIAISRSSVRRILLAEGIASPKTHRAPKHRRRRERYPQEGMLLQIDGSRHQWLEERGPWLTLILAVDDATSKHPAGLFREQEDAHGYFLLLEEIVRRHGRPLALYHDRHGIFIPNRGRGETIAEQLAGRREPTQFGRLLEELGISSIGAHSPQAKGRVERGFGTLQERLVFALREAGAKTVEEANRVLTSFLPKFDKRFAVEPAQSGMAYRALAPGLRPKEVFCFKYLRVVGADNTVKLGEHRLQLLASRERASYAKARVEVHERLDGSLAVYHEGKSLAIKEAPKEARALRARSGPRAKALAGDGGTSAEPTDVGQAGGGIIDKALVGMLGYSAVEEGRVEGVGTNGAASRSGNRETEDSSGRKVGATTQRTIEGSEGRRTEDPTDREVEDSKARKIEGSGDESRRIASSPVRLSKPAPDHPWRRSSKRPRVTESLNA
jgi:transposase